MSENNTIEYKSSKELVMAERLALKVKEYGGRAYFVGGYVRDYIRKVDTKDIDIEIHGITPDKLEEILDLLGERTEYGKSFGVYALKGYAIDIAMPRKETKTGDGHKNFKVSVEPFMGTEQAAIRRDFTVNSLMMDILTGEICDHFGGIDDIDNKVIRHIDDVRFVEDPLRVLRGAQFASRFGYDIWHKTMEICSEISLESLSPERVNEEVKKALLSSERPSVFFKALKAMNKLDYWFGELKDLCGIEQNPAFHPEGDVWQHTMLVLDEAAKYRNEVSVPYAFMLSALCHDFGKAVSTVVTDGVIKSYNHEMEGIQLAKTFISRFVGEKSVLKYVLNMTELHMKPYVLATDKSSVKATNKMFDNSICPGDLIYLSLADNFTKKGQSSYAENAEFLKQRLEIYNDIMSREYVTGNDLIEMGIAPDANFRQIMDYAHKLRLAGTDKDSALKQTYAYARSFIKKQ